MRLYVTPFKSKEKAHAENCGLHGLHPDVRTFPDTVTIPGQRATLTLQSQHC
jgi:hypothetical protein